MISYDTETTGVDLKHGTMPYFVTTCDEEDNQNFWEWDVDPLTREPDIPPDDVDEIVKVVEDDWVVMHNAVFDVRVSELMGIEFDWNYVHDSLCASHIECTNTPHNLTHLIKFFLGVDVKPFEDQVKVCTNHARDICKRTLKNWKIAGEGVYGMPSVKSTNNDKRGTEGESYWKADMWLPRTIVRLEPELLPEKSIKRDKVNPFPYINTRTNKPWKEGDNPEDHEWNTSVQEYANSDTWGTIHVWNALKKIIKKRGYWKHYIERKKILPIVHKMENTGLSLSRSRLEELKADYGNIVSNDEKTMKDIAKTYGYDLDVPKGATNNSLKWFCFGHTPPNKGTGVTECKSCGKARPKTERGVRGWRVKAGQPEDSQDLLYCSKKCYWQRKTYNWLDLPVVLETDKGEPTTNKQAVDIYQATLDEGTDQRIFIDHLSSKRKLGKSLEYIDSYEKFWIQDTYNIRGRQLRIQDQFRLFPSLNPFGTDTLRWSSHNPSQQVISKKKDHNGRNLRYIFGPGRKRVWYSLDYDNLELRLPAYECGESAMLELFENPNSAPYYGSYHLLIFSILHPDKYDHNDPEGLLKAKDKYASTYYQWTKNGNFAELYGAVDTGDGRGTADIAFHVPGAQAIISEKLSEKNNLNKYWINYANEHGYVETMPDVEIDGKKGYPIRCKTNMWSKVVETTPLNYHIQGTACWVMFRAMIKIQKILDENNRGLPERQHAHMIANVHDEVILDLPDNMDGNVDHNEPLMRKVQKAMESQGPVLCPNKVILTCGLDRHEGSWLNSVSM